MSAIRFARATRSLDVVLRFYRDALGLIELDRFRDHEGFDGVILGLPGTRHQLEFTQSRFEKPGQPGPGDLLVLYMPDARELARLRRRMARHGYRAVPPSNPYWRRRAVTFSDPDGWSLVLCRSESPAVATRRKKRES